MSSTSDYINKRIIYTHKNGTKTYTQISEVPGNDDIIPVSRGGTGITTYNIGDLLYASDVQTLSVLNDVTSGNVLISGGVNMPPMYGKIDMSTMITGILPVPNGGTNISSYIAGDILYASNASTLSTLAIGAANTVLISDGLSLSYSKVDLSNMISGILPVANGGTNISSYTAGDLLYASGVSTLSTLAIGAANTALISDGLSLSYSKVNLSNMVSNILDVPNGGTNISSYTTGDLLYASGTSTLSKLGIGASNTALISNGTSLSYSKVDLTSMISNVLPIANGGTNISSYIAGDLLYASSTNILNKLAIGAINTALLSNGTTISYGKVDMSSMVTDTLPIANGGTNILTYTAGDILYASGTTTLSKLGIGATNTVLLSSGSGLPSYGKIALDTMTTGNLPVTNGGLGLSSYTTGDVIYASAPNVLSTLPLGAASTVLTSNGTTLAYAKINLASYNMVTGVLRAQNGGTGLSSYTIGDIIYASASTTLTQLNIGTTNTVLLSTGSGIPSYAKVDMSSMVTGTLPVANGGTGTTTSTGSGSVVLSNSPSLVTPVLGTPTSGNLSNCTNIPWGLSGVGATGGGGGTLSSAVVSISSSQIKNLLATPVTVIAGIAGYVHILLGVIAEYTYIAPAYAAGSNIVLRYRGSLATNVSNVVLTTAVLTNVNNARSILFGGYLGYITPTTNTFSGCAVTLELNAASAYTTGNGTILLRFLYVPMPISAGN